ncbi:hypothetical protein MHM88_11265 [Epibacterium sp. MM17-32]|uniref:capsid assembly protein n=1 Tax=Epibacterium sp. MM17-32 TaxID=2917734 RepID=UPI001EF5E630|nr:hypothetical protein [Epibacterium sp. MM17-32]MCG7628387.1 hypothetical protein [Epibacterium sp. MM17-32]
MANEDTQGNAQDLSGVTITQGGEAETYVADTSAAGGEGELLAGKFKGQEALEAAYKELEKKLGQQSQQPPADEDTNATDAAADADSNATEEKAAGGEGDTEENPYGPVVTEALKKADLNLDDIKKEFTDNNGTLTDDSFDAFEKAGFPRAMVESYFRGIQASQGNADSAAEAQVTQIKEAAGGDAQFAEIQKHIANSFTVAEAQAYNEAVSSGDFGKAKAAVEAARDSYLKEIGVEGEMNSGGSTPKAGQGYSTEAEMLEDMAKPEYKTSQVFRDKVAAKIASSEIFATR